MAQPLEPLQLPNDLQICLNDVSNKYIKLKPKLVKMQSLLGRILDGIFVHRTHQFLFCFGQCGASDDLQPTEKKINNLTLN